MGNPDRLTSVNIRPWLPEDANDLPALMIGFLAEHYSVGGDILPTLNNAPNSNGICHDRFMA